MLGRPLTREWSTRTRNRNGGPGTRAGIGVLNAPAMVYVYSVPGDNEEVTRENYATACCAVQNMALSAVAEGLCLDWSTGGVTQHPDLAETLGADKDWMMVGALFIGRSAYSSPFEADITLRVRHLAGMKRSAGPWATR